MNSFAGSLAVGFLCMAALSASASNSIEVDLSAGKVNFHDFRLGANTVSGTIVLDVQRENQAVIYDVSSSELSVNGVACAPLAARVAQNGDEVVVNYLSLPWITVHGTLDLGTGNVVFDIDGTWGDEAAEFVDGTLSVKAKVWGTVRNYLTSGFLTVRNGTYQNSEFDQLRIDFIGKPPVLNITDSQVILKDGSIVSIEGILDLRNFADLMPGAQFRTQKMYIGKWQLFSGADSVGLKKQLDEKFDIFLNTSPAGAENSRAATELRFNVNDDKYLRLTNEDDRSILQIEQRRDF